MPDVVRPCETKAKSSKKGWKWHGELVSYPTFGKDWNSSKSWKQKSSSDTSRDRCRRAEGFRKHIAIDDSLEGVSGRDAACGWAVVQLDCGKKEEPRYAIYGTMLAELELQRTINSASRPTVWAFFLGCVGENKRCILPEQKGADLWIKIWDFVDRVCREGVRVGRETMRRRTVQKEKKALA